MSNPASPLRVLLVEDSLVNQKLLTGLLERWNCAVTLATNGQQAVQKYAEDEFDVVLMDIQMPVMDGLTATRLIRQQEGTMKRTPIVAITAGMDRQSCLDAGVDEYLAKPVLATSLYEKIEQLLGGSRAI
jgi:CheY-like chemotaxis protein